MTLSIVHICQRDESRACAECDRITAVFHMLMFTPFRKHLVAYLQTNWFIGIFIR